MSKRRRQTQSADCIRSFQNSWLAETDFKDFLIKKVKPQDNTEYPYCNACSQFLANKKHSISVHKESDGHKKCMDSYQEKIREQHRMAAFGNNPVENNAKSLELRLSLLVAQHNLAFSLPQEILNVFKKELPTNPVLKCVSLGKTKTSNIIREGIGKFITIELAEKLRENFFVVIIDESTDVSTKNKMAIVTCYWDGKLNSYMLKLKRCKDATAEGLYSKLIEEIEKWNIPIRQMVGFSSDTCNAMWGEHNSVVKRLKEKIPHIVAVKCACHNSHLCSSKAFAMLPSQFEEFLRQLPNFFSSSYKNKDDLVDFQEFCNVAQHAILKPGLTRWLTLQPCAVRILEQYNSLLLFFTSLVNEKPKDSNTKMLRLLRDPFTKCYLQFLVVVLDKFNKFNATFQSNKPLLHELQSYVHSLTIDLARSYLNGGYVSGLKTCPLTIDPKKETSFLPLRNIYIGGQKSDEAVAECQKVLTVTDELTGLPTERQKQYLTMFFSNERAEADTKARKRALDYVKEKKIPVPEKNAPPNDPTRRIYDSVFAAEYKEEFESVFTPIDYFFISVRNFYATAVSEIKKRFNFDDDVFNILPIVKPKNARQLSPQSLSSLFKRFPVLRESINEDDAESEWRAHVNLPDDYFDVSSSHEYAVMDPEFYWNRVFACKTPSGNPQFSNLKVCISLLLSLPFSNAAAERCFSVMKDTKPPKKNNLHDKSVDGIMKGKMWLKSQNKSAATIEIPDALMKLAKKVKTNAAIQSSESDPDA